MGVSDDEWGRKVEDWGWEQQPMSGVKKWRRDHHERRRQQGMNKGERQREQQWRMNEGERDRDSNSGT